MEGLETRGGWYITRIHPQQPGNGCTAGGRAVDYEAKQLSYFESERAHTLILISIHVLKDQVKAASEKKWIYVVYGGRAGNFSPPKSGQNRNPQ